MHCPKPHPNHKILIKYIICSPKKITANLPNYILHLKIKDILAITYSISLVYYYLLFSDLRKIINLNLFAYVSPKVWNLLPYSLHQIQTAILFKKHCKCYHSMKWRRPSSVGQSAELEIARLLVRYPWVLDITSLCPWERHLTLIF